jgi:hypothetical protein
MSNEIHNKVVSFKSRSPKGLTRHEIELLLKKFKSVSQKRFFEAMGVCTVQVIKGEIIYYRSDIITAITCCIEKRDINASEFD